MNRRSLLLAAAGALVARPGCAEPLAASRMELPSFTHSPFPYAGTVPATGLPFRDAFDGKRHGHVTRDGSIRWEDETYGDRRSLAFFPAGFDPDRPATIVVFFHGNGATLERDVIARQGVPRQLAAAGINAVLLAPQFAVDAPDSSSGNFWTPGFFAAYLEEAATKLARAYGDPSRRDDFARMPVIILAYSGGYNPAAFAVGVGGADERVAGLVLLDALYAEEDRVADWMARNRGHAFLFSAYTKSAAASNAVLRKLLRERGVPFRSGPPRRLTPGSVTFLATEPDLDHNDLVTRAWTKDPVAWILRRYPG